MCRAAPAFVTRVDGEVAWIDQDGEELPVSTLSLPDLAPGEYVYCHAGLALQRISPEEAQEILAVYAELDRLLAADEID